MPPSSQHLQRLLTALFPPHCALCGDAGARGLDLCTGCLADLPFNRPCCSRCALPLPVDGDCGHCLTHPPGYALSFALFRYGHPVDHLITALKFHGRLNMARLLGELMVEALAGRDRPLPTLLIPVPLHRSRLRARGYNQALELARPLARRLRIALGHQYCARVRATQPQTELSAEQRRQNVHGAFRITRPLPARHVAIIDDVVTTGHTVEELAAALQRAGVETVEVWSCARALPAQG
jgi:ComF family protein